MLESIHYLVIMICEAKNVLQGYGEQKVPLGGGFDDDEVPMDNESRVFGLGVRGGSFYQNLLRPRDLLKSFE